MAALMENRTKALLREGKRVYGTAVGEYTSPVYAQLAAQAGYDYLMIDREHNAWNIQSLREMVRSCRARGITPIVRIPDMVPHWISQTLDLGAQGIMVPRVESRETVEVALQRMKYPPEGERGLAPGLGHSDYMPCDAAELVRHQNEHTMLVIQIESRVAVERVDDIVSVPGVDAVMIGPMDLSLSLGVVGQVDHPEMREAMQTVMDACERHGVAGGMHMGDTDLLVAWAGRGARFLTYGGDIGFVMAGLRGGIERLRQSK